VFISEAVVYYDFHSTQEYIHYDVCCMQVSKPSLTWKLSAFQQACLAILNHSGTSCDPKCGREQLRTLSLKFVRVYVSIGSTPAEN